MSKNKRTNYEIKPRLGVNLYLCVDSNHRFIDVFVDPQTVISAAKLKLN
jgi:hypothetical protein